MREITKNEILGLITVLLLLHTLTFIVLFTSDEPTPVGYYASTGVTKVTVINDPPLLLPIPDQTWEQDQTITIDLDDYFSDPEGIPLDFTYTPMDHITVLINPADNTAMFIPEPGWGGVQHIVFYASDGPNTRASNSVTLTVNSLDDGDDRPSGGGGSSGCRYQWECQPWSGCLQEDIQKRACLNLGTCPEIYNAPVTTRPCAYEDNPENEKRPVIELPNVPIMPIEKKPTEIGTGNMTTDELVAFCDAYAQPGSNNIQLSNALIGSAAGIVLLGAFFLLFGLLMPCVIFPRSAEKMLGEVPRRKIFISKDEQVAWTMKSMAKILQYMKKDDFNYHVQDDRDDIVYWIKCAVGDKVLAERLRDLKKKSSWRYATLIFRRIRELNKQPRKKGLKSLPSGYKEPPKKEKILDKKLTKRPSKKDKKAKSFYSSKSKK